MKSTRYLNVILTVNAFLLSGLLWTQIADRPFLDREAAAQRTSRSSRVSRTQTQPFPNAAQQRLDQRMLLQDFRQAFDEQRRFLESGQLKVEVTNLDDLRITIVE
mgnify:CR=1 FL=1